MATSKKTAKKPKSRKSKTRSIKRGTKATARKTARKATKTKRAAKSKSQKRTAAAKRKPAAKTKPKAPASSPSAMRLVFSYQGNEVKLVGQQPVDMVVPPSDSLEGYDEHKGFWAELKNKQHKTVFRRVMHNPTRNDAEVFSDDPEQGISRQPAPNRKGVFVVVVPNTDASHEVTLSRSTAQLSQPVAGMRKSRLRSLATTPAKEFARFKLKK